MFDCYERDGGFLFVSDKEDELPFSGKALVVIHASRSDVRLLPAE